MTRLPGGDGVGPEGDDANVVLDISSSVKHWASFFLLESIVSARWLLSTILRFWTALIATRVSCRVIRFWTVLVATSISYKVKNTRERITSQYSLYDFCQQLRMLLVCRYSRMLYCESDTVVDTVCIILAEVAVPGPPS